MKKCNTGCQLSIKKAPLYCESCKFIHCRKTCSWSRWEQNPCLLILELLGSQRSLHLHLAGFSNRLNLPWSTYSGCSFALVKKQLLKTAILCNICQMDFYWSKLFIFRLKPANWKPSLALLPWEVGFQKTIPSLSFLGGVSIFGSEDIFAKNKLWQEGTKAQKPSYELFDGATRLVRTNLTWITGHVSSVL